VLQITLSEITTCRRR